MELTEAKEILQYLKEDYIEETKIRKFYTVPIHIDEKDIEAIEVVLKEIEYLKKNQRYKKDFNGDKIFCLEYDKETLRDMVLEQQEEIKELKSNSIPKDKIRKLEDMWNDNIWNATDEASEEKAEMIRDVYRGLLDE